MQKNIFFLLACLMTLVACNNTKKKPDISNIKIEQNFYRFDKDLYNLELNKDSIDYTLIEKYGKFMEMYSYNIINIGNPYSKNFSDHLKTFKEDYIVSQVYEEVEEKFKSTDQLKDDFNKAFRYYNYYFPEKQIPNIYTFVSGFNKSIVTDDSILGIGLDFYLGNDCKFYPQLALPNYIIQKMVPEMILPDAMYGWFTMEFPQKDTTDNMLANMIYFGKIQYMIKSVLPDVADSLCFGFQDKKLDWCYDNEQRVWTYFIENKLLFSKDHLTIKKFIDEGPFTVPFGPQSPPKTGVWIGYRIVSSYMEKNPKTTLKDLMDENNFQKILTLSAYNP